MVTVGALWREIDEKQRQIRFEKRGARLAGEKLKVVTVAARYVKKSTRNRARFAQYGAKTTKSL